MDSVAELFRRKIFERCKIIVEFDFVEKLFVVGVEAKDKSGAKFAQSVDISVVAISIIFINSRADFANNFCGVFRDFNFGLDFGIRVDDKFQLSKIVTKIFKFNDGWLVNCNSRKILELIHLRQIVNAKLVKIARDDFARSFRGGQIVDVTFSLFKGREIFAV